MVPMRALILLALLGGCTFFGGDEGEQPDNVGQTVLDLCGPAPKAPDVATTLDTVREIDGVKYWVMPVDDAGDLVAWRQATVDWTYCVVSIQ